MRCAAICLLLLSACAPTPKLAPSVTWADLAPIVAPLTYREVLGDKCKAKDMAVMTAFLADLTSAGASPGLIAQSRAEADRIAAEERDTPEEYVCTAELFESTEKNAAAAQRAWAELKGRKA